MGMGSIDGSDLGFDVFVLLIFSWGEVGFRVVGWDNCLRG